MPEQSSASTERVQAAVSGGGCYRIYSDFAAESERIRRIHRQEILSFPKVVRDLAKHYLTKRLIIINRTPVKIDPRFGRPVPYLAFWFADGFGLDGKTAGQLGLSLSYISLCVSVRDDIMDGDVVASPASDMAHAAKGHSEPPAAHWYLANEYYNRYLEIFGRIFPPESGIWHVLLRCLKSWNEYEKWDLEQARKLGPGRASGMADPLSDEFLSKSSQYLVAITLPSIAATALLTGNGAKMPQLERFLRYYCMGWKILDDLRDWNKDVAAPNLNNSSVLHCAQRAGYNFDPRDSTSKLSMLTQPGFADRVYGRVLGLFKAARSEAAGLNCQYATSFMDSQISFHTDEWDYLARVQGEFRQALCRYLYKLQPKAAAAKT